MSQRLAETCEQVLDVLRRSSGPATAYGVLSELKKGNAKLAPTTIYRALNALVDAGRAHRLESINAYVTCQCGGHKEPAVLTICDDCGVVEETLAPSILSQLSGVAEQSGFKAKRHIIELHGSCGTCEQSR